MHAINSAKERIWIASPYFVPDDAIMSALQLAGLRGVDVRILIPDKPDHLLVYLAAFSYFDDASDDRARFYRYTDGFLHEKVMLIDDDIATVARRTSTTVRSGSTSRSPAWSRMRSLRRRSRRCSRTTSRNAREMTQADVDDRSYWFTLSTRLARLTAPVQ